MPMELPPRRITENGYGHHLKRKQILPRVPEISENAPKPAVIQEQCKDESDNDSESDSEDEEKEPSPPKQRLFKRATRCKIVISTASTTTATIEPTSPSSSVGTSPATINQGNSKSPSTISNLSSPTAGALTKVTQNGHGMSKAMKDAVTATGVIGRCPLSQFALRNVSPNSEQWELRSLELLHSLSIEDTSRRSTQKLVRTERTRQFLLGIGLVDKQHKWHLRCRFSHVDLCHIQRSCTKPLQPIIPTGR